MSTVYTEFFHKRNRMQRILETAIYVRKEKKETAQQRYYRYNKKRTQKLTLKRPKFQITLGTTEKITKIVGFLKKDGY